MSLFPKIPALGRMRIKLCVLLVMSESVSEVLGSDEVARWTFLP